MLHTPHATLQAIVVAAADATAAAHGWLLAVDGDDGMLAVAVTLTGPGGPSGGVTGSRYPVGEGSAGYVVSSGQPLALRPRAGSGDPGAAEHPLVGRVPGSILAVPCEDDTGLLGVLELLDRHQGPFTFDDVEVVTLLGGIAGAALGEGARRGPTVAHPRELERDLSRVLSDDPARYERIAAVTQALLADG